MKKNVFRAYSLKGLYYQYRSAIAFLSTGKGDLIRFTLARTHLIQVWHGIPIKRILLDSTETIPFTANSIWLKLATVILKRDLSKYDLVLASSEKVRSRLMSAFSLPLNKIPITGYPRHDIILEHAAGKQKRILYAPTWRTDQNKAEHIVRQVCNPVFLHSIKNMGYDLWVSIHLLNTEIETKLRDEMKGEVIFVGDNDINKVMAQSEILITDYSSVAIDFSILGRQVIFFTPDLDEYLLSRGLYSEFETIIRKNGVKTPNSILTMLKQSPSLNKVITEDLYFRFHDSGSRERIVNLVMNKFMK